MREIEAGGELGITETVGGTVTTETTEVGGPLAPYGDGNGSERFYKTLLVGGVGRYVELSRDLEHIRFSIRAYIRGDSVWDRFTVRLLDNAGDLLGVIHYNGATPIEIRDETATPLATAASPPPKDRWFRLTVDWYAHASSGAVSVLLDGVAHVSVSGVDTTGTATTIRRVEPNIVFRCYWDDLVVNSITAAYKLGTGGLPAAGDTLTGAGGTTAIIADYDGDATSGTLWLTNPDGSFADGEGLTAPTNGFSASVNAPTADYIGGFHPNSSAPGNEFVRYLTVTDTVDPAQWTGDDADQVDNHLLIDDQPVDDSTDHIYAESANLIERFELESLPSRVATITHVAVVASASKDGSTLTNHRTRLRILGSEYEEAADVPLSDSYALVYNRYDTRPDGIGAFETDVIETARVGIRSRPA